MSNTASTVYDVAVIGAGVVGSAIARELSKYQLKTVLIEAKSDIGAGTSKANTAILHTGYDAKPAYLEAKLVRRGYELLLEYSTEAGIPVEKTGGLLIAWNEEQEKALPSILEQAHTNGVDDVAFISVEELYKREPHLASGARAALEVPGEYIICPFTTPLAYATQAVVNGVELKLNSPVQSIQKADSGNYRITTPSETVQCQYVINAAGLYSDEINRVMGHNTFHVTPRRGELIVFDKMARSLVNHILMPVPTGITKGVMICPTVFGNILLGPTAENLDDKTARETTAEGLAAILEKGREIVPALVKQEVTSTYAGLRAATEFGDYQIISYPEERYVCVGGIRSTGLTASMAIAEYTVQCLMQAGLNLTFKSDFRSIKMPNIGEAFQRPYQSDEMIQVNPDYGRIVCHCEFVTRGEILDATKSVIPAHNSDSLRRRTRALLGRCQGFFCSAEIAALLAEATQQPVAQLLKMD